MVDGLAKLKAPDPAKAHGAWVYLVISIVAGVLSAARFDPATACLAGLAFLGVFLSASSLATYPRRWLGRFVAGLALVALCVATALVLGSNPMFLAYGAVAVFPAAAAIRPY